MTDVHDASADATTPPVQVDPTFDLLDRPVALESADDIVLTAPAPDAPTVDGRPVEDPRLIEALSVPQEFQKGQARRAGQCRLLLPRLLPCRTGFGGKKSRIRITILHSRTMLLWHSGKAGVVRGTLFRNTRIT